MSSYTLLKGGKIVTMNPQGDYFEGDLLIKDNTIVELSPKIKEKPEYLTIDVNGQFVIPGLIQVHTHLCQALFRGLADDLSLIRWLQQKIWPFEHAHSESSIKASAQVALHEMQLLGTTSVLDMGTVAHTHALLEEVQKSQMRYWGGKCLMDLEGSCGPLFEEKNTSLRETEQLLKQWKSNSLITYALCPRFAVSCSDDMMSDCAGLQQDHNLLIHTHASESLEEIQMIKDRTGLLNIEYFYKLGILNPKTVIVHGVHLTEAEQEMMVSSRAPLVHCPSSNLKLASGIAPIQEYLQKGMTIGIGADGAPCNNSMDPFLEMRLTALLQKPKFGPEALPAKKALEMMTLGGARVLGAENNLGSLEVGKLADIVVVKPDHPSCMTVEDPYSALVYSCSGRDVNHVLINGKLIVSNRQHNFYELEQTKHLCKVQLDLLLSRVY